MVEYKNDTIKILGAQVKKSELYCKKIKIQGDKMFKYSYKSYKVSKLATAISGVGGFFNAIGKIFPVILIIQLIKSALGQSSVGKSNLYRAIIFCIIASIVMFIIGFIFNLIAKKLALKEYAKSGDMDSYHTLKIMMKSQKIYNYFIDNNITDENLFNMNLDEYNMLLKEYNEAYEEFEKQDIKGNTVHTESFCDFTAAYHSFVNNISNMVKEKNYDTGNLDGPEGLVGPSDDEDIQQRLYFYIDRMTSAYNSIQGFKEYFQE